MIHPRIHRRRGFTLLEILVAISIILVLSGILILGAKSVMSSSKTSSTKTTLQALQNMLAEFEVQTHFKKSPVQWLWFDGNATKPVTAASGPDDDFWHIPFRLSDATTSPAAVDAPGNVTADSDANRNYGRQVLNTQLVMTMMLSMPVNRTSLQKLPMDRLFIPTMPKPPKAVENVDTPGSDGTLYFQSDSTEAPKFPSGVKLQAYDGSGATVRYVNVHSDPSTLTTTAPTGPGGDWALDNNSPVAPLLLDAWNNPIIFVPGSGLRVRLLNGEKKNDPSKIEQTFIILSPEGKVKPGTTTDAPYVLQPGRPFFASAGPDGDFSTGDDNLYSFDQ